MCALQECSPGTYNRWPGGDVCHDCAEGTYTADYGQSYCTACDPGTYQQAGVPLREGCTDCPVNTYKEWDGAGTCQTCFAGTFSPLAGAHMPDACYQCEPGRCELAAGRECHPRPIPLSLLLGASTLTTSSAMSRFGPYDPVTWQSTGPCEECPHGLATEYFGDYECIDCADWCGWPL